MAKTEQDVVAQNAPTRKRSNAMTKQTMRRYIPQQNTPNSMTAAVMNYVPPPTNNGPNPPIPPHSQDLLNHSATQRRNFLGAGRKATQNPPTNDVTPPPVTNATTPPKPKGPAPRPLGRGLRPPVTDAQNVTQTPPVTEPTNDVTPPPATNATTQTTQETPQRQRSNSVSQPSKPENNRQRRTISAPNEKVTPRTSPDAPLKTAWGGGGRVNVSQQARAAGRSFVDLKLQEALDLTRTDPKEYLTIVQNTAVQSAKQAYENLVKAMNDVYKISASDSRYTVKGMTLPGYCQRAYDAAAACIDEYAYQGTVSGLEVYLANMRTAMDLLKEWQNSEGNVNFNTPSSETVGNSGGNDLSVHKDVKGRGIGRPETTKFFRPKAHDLVGMQSGAGVEKSGTDSVRREIAFYILSEYLQTGLVTPTRAGTRTEGDKTVEGAVLNGARGYEANQYNYKYMGISDYQNGDKTQNGGELIYYQNNTLADRMKTAGTNFEVKTSQMTNVPTVFGGPKSQQLKGGTLDLLDSHFLRDLNRLNLLDILGGQPDRHQGNFMVETDKKGKYKGMTAIDNGDGFGSAENNNLAQEAGTNAFNQTGIKAGMHMDKELTDRILAAKKEDIEELLRDYLTPKEIAALWKRFEGLQKIIIENHALEDELNKGLKADDPNRKKLFLSEEDWDTENMEELVKDEMSFSNGAGTPVRTTSGNSYISKMMFMAQAFDETAQAARDGKKKPHGGGHSVVAVNPNSY